MIRALRRFRLTGLLLLWAAALLLFAVFAPGFFTLGNFTSVLQFSTLLALVTLGQTVVILAGGGGIDLSVGGIVSLSGLLVAYLVKQNVPFAWSGVVGVLFGAFLGAINGWIITRIKLLPLIVTLGTFYAYNGIALAVTGGAPIAGLPNSFAVLGQTSLGIIPLHTLVFVLPVFAGLWLTLEQTPLGRWIYAIGGNEIAARLVGLPVDGVRLAAYSASGSFAALAGLVADSWLLSARPNIGQNLELLSLTAALLGGVNIFGGAGGVGGPFLAVFFFTSLQIGLEMMNVNTIWQLGIVGLLLIASVYFSYRTADNL
jgi:ribose transport system permease protein